MRMPFGRYQGRPVNECPEAYLTWLLSSGVRLSASLRRAIEKALVPDRACCTGPRWWHLDQAREGGSADNGLAQKY
jgi:hypothetical protein